MPRAKTAPKKRRVATKPSAHRSLLSLPAEIRNRIWEYVIGGTEPTTEKLHPQKTDFIDVSSPDFKNHIRFVYTCKQIYHETHLMFYHRQKLLFPLNNTPASHLKLLRFAANISPKAHRFVGFETCWSLDHVDRTATQITNEERDSIHTLVVQMASLGWTKRICLLYEPNVFSQACIAGMLAGNLVWGEHAYENRMKRYVFRMLLKHVKTEYLRRRTVAAAWVFLAKPNFQTSRQLLQVWIPGFDPIGDPIRWVGVLLLAYLNFRLKMPFAPEEWNTKTQCLVSVGVQVVLKILWNMRHWVARQALMSLSLIKNLPGTLRAKRRRCERMYKRFQRGLEEKRKREAIHGLDASSTAIFALWPLLLCLVLCVGILVYEYTGPAASLLLSLGATVIGKAVAVFAFLGGYAHQAIA
ncbi:hypothetical protein AC578_5644 [Pseudocercospora eumusae]|uniref:F-box domain-containing protein n=1 Tax=Pseudocercospora eumusae TaxID=321146 RepID=A0A139HT84_9PEZI|nr:hypothetical protein AC578_5644 [Pseudocercospora eumusae]